LVTQADGFQVIVLKGDKESTGSDNQAAALIVNKGIPDVEIPDARQVIELAVPRDAFAHGKPEATVALDARLADDQPLPAWLNFDPIKGQFRGVPPEGFKGEVVIKVVARDNAGAEVETVFRLRVNEVGQDKLSLKGKASLTRQLADAGRAMRLGERDALLAKMRGGAPLTGYAAPVKGGNA
jgi:hypothetical protein